MRFTVNSVEKDYIDIVSFPESICEWLQNTNDYENIKVSLIKKL